MTANTNMKRLTAGLLALAMAISLLPVFGTAALAAAGDYGKIVLDAVKLRLEEPSTSSKYQFEMPKNWIVEIKDTTGSGSALWYKVYAEDPEHPGEFFTGYVLGTCMAPLSEDGYNAWTAAGKPKQGDYQTLSITTGGTEEATTAPPETTAPQSTEPAATDPATTAPVTTAPAASASPIGTIAKTTQNNVNMRKSADGALLVRVEAKGTSMTILDVTTKNGKAWYYLQYGSITGYIVEDFLTLTGEKPATATTGVPVANAVGYVKLVMSSANLRKAPDGARLNEWLPQNGQVMPYVSTPTVKGTYTWYEIKFIDGKNYFVRGDTVMVCDVNGNALTATAAPTDTAGATATATATATASNIGLLRVIKSDVNFRKTEGGQVQGQIPKNTELYFTAISNKGGYNWYYVTDASGVKGYLRDDCITVLSSEATAPAGGTSAPTTGAYGSFKLTVDNVLLRVKPAGTYIEKLKINTVLPVVGAPTTSGSYTWYPVQTADGKNGYVRDDTGTYSGGAAGTTSPGTGTGTTGSYIIITKPSVNLRKTAGGSVIGRVDEKDVYQLTGSKTTSGSYDWYPIKAGALSGYVRGDMCRQLTDEQVQEYLAGQPISSATPAPTGSAQTQYLITVKSDVNLRVSASKDAESKAKVDINTVYAYSTSQSVGGATWYKVVHNNESLWVIDDCIKIMTQAEYDAWRAANPTATTPPSDVVTGYVKTTVDSLNIRKSAGGAVTGNRISKKGTVLSYQGSPVLYGKTYYYYCKTEYGYGYIDGNYLEVTDASGNPTATPAPSPTSTGSAKEASYSTLKVGSSGTAVKALVTELKAQGYFSGSITSSYTTAVKNAVIAFQRAKGLAVDGIAGPTTQHALFGTVPVGTGTEPGFTMYPVEKIDWYTGGIQTLWAKGKNAVLKDVKTGLVINVHRWSGGNHADVEPLTAGDTARICKMYGVSSADQITSTKHWQRRPVWVTVGGRTFAASMYGVPHNYPDGDTIANNDFRGQFCIHFVNSKTHTSNRVDADHQAAIETAYQAAPSRK